MFLPQTRRAYFARNRHRGVTPRAERSMSRLRPIEHGVPGLLTPEPQCKQASLYAQHAALAVMLPSQIETLLK